MFNKTICGNCQIDIFKDATVNLNNKMVSYYIFHWRLVTILVIDLLEGFIVHYFNVAICYGQKYFLVHAQHVSDWGKMSISAPLCSTPLADLCIQTVLLNKDNGITVSERQGSSKHTDTASSSLFFILAYSALLGEGNCLNGVYNLKCGNSLLWTNVLLNCWRAITKH